MKNKIILILGSHGFLGQAFTQYVCLKKKYFKVYCADMHKTSKQKNYVQCDLRKKKQCKDLLNDVNPDFIFHFAGGRVFDEKKLLDSNYKTTENNHFNYFE